MILGQKLIDYFFSLTLKLITLKGPCIDVTEASSIASLGGRRGVFVNVQCCVGRWWVGQGDAGHSC